jgi:hypothetical protein
VRSKTGLLSVYGSGFRVPIDDKVCRDGQELPLVLALGNNERGEGMSDVENAAVSTTALPSMEDEYWLMIEVLRSKVKELERELKRTKFAWNMAENEIETLQKKNKLLERDYNFMKDLAIGTEDLLRKAQENE